MWIGTDDEDEEKRFWKLVIITEIPKFCSHCKIVGHLVSECRSKKDVVTDVIVDSNVPNEIRKKKKRSSN